MTTQCQGEFDPTQFDRDVPHDSNESMVSCPAMQSDPTNDIHNALTKPHS